uniref:Cytochrome b561 domain-containing protein n=1 Tax=Arcella intermedia TaxID=1963864 RepID=A0A6B2LHM5_9EUKA
MFFWHPFGMSVSFLFLMVQGGLLLVDEAALLRLLCYKMEFNRSNVVAVHFYVQLLSCLCYVGGFIAIYLHKIRLGKPHFLSWHARFGLATVISCLFFQLLFGLLMHVSVVEKTLSKLMTLPAKTKLRQFHRRSSVFSFELGMVTTILSCYSLFVKDNFPSNAEVIIPAVAAFLALTVPIFVFKLFPARVPVITKLENNV